MAVSNDQSGNTSNTKLKIILAIPTAETNTRWPIPVKRNARNAVSEGRREEVSLPKLSNRDTGSIICIVSLPKLNWKHYIS